MPSQHEVRWSQLKVGVIVLIAAVVLVTLLFLMTSSSGLGLFSKKLMETTYFENSAGLKDGAGVNLEGVTVGEVKHVEVVTDPARKLTPVKVVMEIDGKYQKDLHTDTKAALTTVGVLGDTVVDLNSQVAVGPELQNNSELKTLETPSITDVVKASQGTIEQLNVILAKMNTIVDNLQDGKGSVGQLINNPDLYNKAAATVSELNTIETNLNNGRGSIGKLMTDDTLFNRLNTAAEKLNQIGDSVQHGKGTAAMLINDPKFADSLRQTVARTNDLLDQVQHGQGAAGMLINDPKFANQLRDTLAQANTVLTGVNQGRGTLGKLATDDQAYANLNKLLTQSTLLVDTLRADPKKYLTIHLKIF
jgi:phospholipid/cholesterol/gamma-HCH transport system substrate-binding protein